MKLNIIENPFTEATATAVTPEELAAFVAALKVIVEAAHKASYPTCESNWGSIEHKGGTKYAKIVATRPNSAGGSAYCFIDLSNGNILKPASWKAPAKHARGNIRVGDASTWWNGALYIYGAAYLR